MAPTATVITIVERYRSDVNIDTVIALGGYLMIINIIYSLLKTCFLSFY